MNIVIADDYQRCVRDLACFSLLDGHSVKSYETAAESREELIERPSRRTTPARRIFNMGRPFDGFIGLRSQSRAIRTEGMVVSSFISTCPKLPDSLVRCEECYRCRREVLLTYIKLSINRLALSSRYISRGHQPTALHLPVARKGLTQPYPLGFV